MGLSPTIVRASALIRAPISEVFNYLADGENAPQWHPSIVEASRIQGTRLGVGSTVKYKARVGPFEVVWVTRAVEFRWNEGFKDVLVRVEKGPLKSYTLTGRFEEEGGATRVELHLEYELAWGPLGRLLDALLVRRRLRRHMVEGLERARRILEGGGRGVEGASSGQ